MSERGELSEVLSSRVARTRPRPGLGELSLIEPHGASAGPERSEEAA